MLINCAQQQINPAQLTQQFILHRSRSGGGARVGVAAQERAYVSLGSVLQGRARRDDGMQVCEWVYRRRRHPPTSLLLVSSRRRSFAALRCTTNNKPRAHPLFRISNSSLISLLLVTVTGMMPPGNSGLSGSGTTSTCACKPRLLSEWPASSSGNELHGGNGFSSSGSSSRRSKYNRMGDQGQLLRTWREEQPARKASAEQREAASTPAEVAGHDLTYCPGAAPPHRAAPTTRCCCTPT